MAGKVAKAQPVAKFSMHDFNDAPYLEKRQSGGWNMEENDVVDQLKDQRFQRRVEILEQLLITVRRNGGKLPYSNQQQIFRGLGLALTDSNWDVRLKCIQLINEVIPQFGDGLDSCMSEIMGKLIPSIGESKITVRRAVIQTLHVYMKCTSHVPSLLRSIVNYGLESEDARVRKESIVALPMLFTPEFSRENFVEITQSLAKKLLDTSVEDNLRDCSLMTLEKIRTLVGEREFNNYLHKLSAPLRRYYYQMTGQEQPENNEGTGRNSYSLSNQNTPKQGPFSKSKANGSTGAGTSHQPTTSHVAEYIDSYEFGIIPSHIMSQISDQENFKLRAKGVEELRNIMFELRDVDVQSNLMPHMLSFISFLNNLLDDSNFKITTVTLEILCLLVEKLGKNVKQFLKPLSSTLTKRMGDNKIVVRQAVMNVATKMMQSYSPKPVLSVICENLLHKNSKVRQETLNIVIAALLTFPSYAFDLALVCRMVSPTLTDSKRQVRQGALECLSVIAQAMGPGRLQPLVQAVDQVELSQEGEGVMAAVQSRLARRQLPRLNSEGLVEYATPVPSSASTRSSASFQQQGADMEWIVGGSSSARGLSRSDTMELESVNSSSCSTPTSSMTYSENGQSRPYMSAGKGRKKLPWEGQGEHSTGQYDSPPKSRQTWSNSEDSNDVYNKKPIVKRRTAPIITPGSEETQQEATYKAIHLAKLKKQQSGPVKSTSYRSLDLGIQNDKDAKDNGSRKPLAKSFLDPIAADFDYFDDFSYDPPYTPIEDFKPAEKDNEDSPIPLKATLVRSATRRNNTRKVPPISSSNKYSDKDDDTDSAYAASLGSTLEAESHFEMMESLKGIHVQEQMMNSLMSIRSSATKKKEKAIEKQSSTSSLLSRSRSPSPDSTLRESGFWSTYSNKESDADLSQKSKKSKKIESPFESRPKLARTGSLHNSNGKIEDGDKIYVDYNPQSGVTFRENKNANVEIVGKGYEDGSSGGVLDSRSQYSIGSNSNKSKERRPSKVTKGSVLSPLGVASMHSYGSLDLEDDKTPTPEGIGVVGIGMFENVNGTEHAINTGNSQSNDRQDRKPMKQDRKDIPSGVVGVSMNKQGSMDDPSMDILDDVDDDPNNLRMSQRLSDKIAQMQKQKEEEAEIKRVEREKKKQDHEEKLKKERERQQEKLRRLNTSESLALSISGAGSGAGSGAASGTGSGTNSGYNTPKTRSSPSLTPRKKSRPQMESESSHPSSASSRTPLDSDDPKDWKPYKDPELAMRQAIKTIGQEDWEMKCNGIIGFRKLTMFHKEMLVANLHQSVVALLLEVKNLRSQVSRLAIVCIGEMFTNLTRYMETDLDIIVRGLLAKNGETNMFIREDSERALAAMVDSVNPQRALLALISGGATHKNSNVRKTTSVFLVMLVQRMGPGRILSGVKDITDRILPAVAQFAIDGSPETRYNGKKILYQLMTHQDFDKMLQKHLPTNTLRNVKDLVESLRMKGLGDGPGETSSARGWRSGHGSRSSSVIRGSSAGSDNHHATPKRRNTRTDESTMEEIKDVINLMSANDWRDRYKGITTLLEMCEMNSNLVASNVVKIFDKFLPRLQDPNSKVNLYALQVMLQIIPILNDALATVISMAVGNVSPNLSSKNKEIYSTAMSIIEAFMDNIDPTQLIQPMANQAQSASARSKPHLVMKVADLVNRVYPKKQKQVILHVLPLLWHLLGATNSSGAVQGGSSTIRTATGKLVNALHSHLGPSLIDRASADPNVTPRHIQLLQDLIDH